jgi:beta-lactamase class D
MHAKERTILKYILLPLLVILLVINVPASEKNKKDEWGEFYKPYNVEGCFILYDLNAGKYYVYNEKRTKEEFLPASTFKVLNSLIGLETGAVKDENEVFKWDSIDRGYDAWNCSQDMRSAMKVSAVWFYQELARRIGEKQMQHFIDSIGYGNRNIGDKIDEFWLSGKLRIKPVEQVEFLKRLYLDDLPFSRRSLNIVKDIMITEKTDDYVLHSKTGWAARADKQYGWWIGYIEKDNNVYFFVNNMDINKSGDEKGRIEISKKILQHMGILN